MTESPDTDTEYCSGTETDRDDAGGGVSRRAFLGSMVGGSAVTGGAFYTAGHVLHELKQEGNTGRTFVYEIGTMNGEYADQDYSFEAETADRPYRAIGTAPMPDMAKTLLESDEETVVDAITEKGHGPPEHRIVTLIPDHKPHSALDHLLKPMYEKHLGQFNRANDVWRRPGLDEYEVRFEDETGYASWLIPGERFPAWSEEDGIVDSAVEQVWDRSDTWQYRIDPGKYDTFFTADNMDVVPYDR